MAQRFSAVAWNTIGRGSILTACMLFLVVFFPENLSFSLIARLFLVRARGPAWPCLERRSRRSLGLSGPKARLGTLGEYWAR